jgi:hypothetical protein
MANILSYIEGGMVGAALVGAWWWWINHKAKARAMLMTAEQAAQQVAKKLD